MNPRSRLFAVRSTFAVCFLLAVALVAGQGCSAGPPDPLGDGPVAKVEAALGESCPVVPPDFVDNDDGCDCPADGDTTCDPDCAASNGGDGYCGCDRCYRDPNAGACADIPSARIGDGSCDCPQSGDTSCDPDCAAEGPGDGECGCDGCHGPEIAGLATRPSFAEPALLDSTEVGSLPGGGSARNGSYTYSIPIDTLKGRAGMEPALTLAYASTAGDGIVGKGWSVAGATSAIHRCPRVNAAGRQAERINFDTTDKFCLDGQRLIVTSGSYGAVNSEYRTEAESYAKVVLTGVTGAGTNGEPTGFTVYYKDGTIGTYERTSATLTRELLNGSGSVGSSSVVTMLWPRTKLVDRRSNRIDYVFERSADTHGTHIPKSIEYTGCDSGTCDYPSSRKRKVEFLYETRPANDTQDRYINGVRMRTTKRMKTIEVSIANTSGVYELVRSYSLRYVQGAVTGRSLVKGVKVCDAGGSSIRCQPETTFLWQGENTISFSSQIGPTSSLVKLRGGTSSSQTLPEENSIAVFDANGDGNDDILLKSWLATVLPPASSPNSLAPTDKLYLSQGNHTFAAGANIDPDGDGVPKQGCVGSEVMDFASALPVDLDSDGRTELIVALNTSCPWVTTHPTPTTSELGRVQPGGNAGLSPETNAQRVYGVLAWDPAKGLTKMSMPGIDGESWNGTEIRMGDMNGDGLPDLLKAAPSNAGWSLRFGQTSNRGGLLPQVAFLGTATIPVNVEPNPNTPDFRPRSFGMADENGDGRAELVQMDYVGRRRSASLSASSTQLIYRFREVVGAQPTSEQVTTLASPAPPNWSAPDLDEACAAQPCPALGQGAWRSVDVNGDGLKDALFHHDSEWRLRINTGTGYAPHQVVSALAGYPVDSAWQSRWAQATAQVLRRGLDNGMRIADMNGDGRDDLVLLAPAASDQRLNHGSGYLEILADPRVAYSNGTTFATPVLLGSGGPSRLHAQGRGFSTQVGDTNGDGLPDLVDMTSVAGDITKRRITVRFLQMLPGWGGLDLIEQVSDERGVAENIAYDTMSKGSNLRPSLFTTQSDTHRSGLLDDWANTPGAADCRYPAPCVGKGPIVRRYENLRSARPVNAYFRYSGARVDVTGRGFVGFNAVEEKDAISGVVVTEMYDPVPLVGTATGENGPSYHLYPKMATASAIYTVHPQASPTSDLSLATNPPVSTAVLTPTYQSYPVRLTRIESRVEIREQSSSTIVKLYTSATDYDTHGSPTSSTEAATQGTSEYKTVRTTEYTNGTTGNDPASWIIGLPTRVTETTSTKDDAFGSGCTPSATPCATSTRTTDFEYDRGLLKKAIREPNDASQNGFKVTRELVRNAAGVITAAKVTAPGPGGETREDRIVHDESGVNVTEVSNALGHKTWLYHRARHNFLYAIADQNGSSTKPDVELVHDRMGRLRVRRTEDGGETSLTYGVGKVEQTLAEVSGAAFSPTSSVFFDTRGRPVIHTWSTFGVTSEKAGVEETVYNSLGQVSRKRYAGTTTAQGQLSTESSARAALTNAQQTFSAAYDTLGRVTSRTRGLNETTTTAYQTPLGTTLVTDPQGNQTSTVVNQKGRVRTLKQFLTNPTKTITTTYGYDDQGNVGHILSPDGARTVLTYDRLGRMTEWNQRHSSNNSVLHRSVTYSGFDEALTEGHGRVGTTPAVNVAFLRDSLGRLTERRDRSAGATETESFVWDLGTGALGQLALATMTYAGAPDDTHQTRYGYNAIGQMTEQRERFRKDGVDQDLSVGFGYDARGRISSIRYPETSANDDVFHPSTGGLTLNYRYQNAQISGIDAGGSTIWDVRDRHPLGFIKAAKPNSSVTMNWERDPNTLRLSRHNVMNGATSLTNLDYAYYSNGLLRERKHDTMDEDFTYDSLSRLKTFERRLGTTLITAATHSYTDAGDITGVDTTTATAQSTDWTNTDESYTYSTSRPNLIATQTVGATTTTFVPDDADRIWRHTVNGTTTREYSYTSFDLPKTIMLPTQNKTVRFKYSADGRRVRKTTTSPGGASVDIVSVGEMYEQRTSVADGTTTGESVFRVPGEDGFLAEVVHPWTPATVGTRTTRYLVNDHQGTPVRTLTGTTISSGTLVGTFPFGKKQGNAASTGIGYTGHIADDDLGLVNMKGRIYDVSQRRFITRDPLLPTPFDAAGANHYAYVRNNPTNLIDPTGFQEMRPEEIAAMMAAQEAGRAAEFARAAALAAANAAIAQASAQAAAAAAQAQAQAAAQAHARAAEQAAQAAAAQGAAAAAQGAAAAAQRSAQGAAEAAARNAAQGHHEAAARAAAATAAAQAVAAANAGAAAAQQATGAAAARGAASAPTAGGSGSGAAPGGGSAGGGSAPVSSEEYRRREQEDAISGDYPPGTGKAMGCREVMCVAPAMAPAEHVRRAIGYAWSAEFAYAWGLAKAHLEWGETDFGASGGLPAGTVPMRPNEEGTGARIFFGGYDPSSMRQMHHSHPMGRPNNPSATDVGISAQYGVPITTHSAGLPSVNLMWQDSSGTFYQTYIPLNYRVPGGPEF